GRHCSYRALAIRKTHQPASSTAGYCRGGRGVCYLGVLQVFSRSFLQRACDDPAPQRGRTRCVSVGCLERKRILELLSGRSRCEDSPRLYRSGCRGHCTVRHRVASRFEDRAASAVFSRDPCLCHDVRQNQYWTSTYSPGLHWFLHCRSERPGLVAATALRRVCGYRSLLVVAYWDVCCQSGLP